MQETEKSSTLFSGFLNDIKYLRHIGFFDTFKSLSDEELKNACEQLFRDEWGEDGFYMPSKYTDLSLLLLLDKDRVWWRDTEADVCSGNSVYVETLQEWSVISRGTFMPENIREEWADEDGPVKLTFTLQGKPREIAPRFLNDYIDVGILSQINKFLVDSGIRFELYKPFDQTAFVVALTPHEKTTLERERGWQFARL